MSSALLQQWVLAVMKQCNEQGVMLDVEPLRDEVLDAVRVKLNAAEYHTLDITAELESQA